MLIKRNAVKCTFSFGQHAASRMYQAPLVINGQVSLWFDQVCLQRDATNPGSPLPSPLRLSA